MRVSATAGLTSFLPDATPSGSSASAQELVFDPLTAFGTVSRVDGRKVTFKVRGDAADLARRIRLRQLTSVDVTGPDELVLTLSDAKSATMVTNPAFSIVDTGPFKVDREEPGVVRLTRRSPGRLDAIEIVETSQQDEWRKLMARELDVIPAAASAFRKELDGIDSIRVFDIPATFDIALYFNVNDPELSDVAVRRKLASTVNREALAQLACGDERCAAAPVASPGDVPLPERLVLSVLETDASLSRTASALSYQLGERGVEVDLRSTTIAEVVARDFQITVMPLPRGAYRFLSFTSPEPGMASVTGFSSPDLDTAFARGDLDAAQRALDDLMPVTPLFENREFAAVDARFCGDVTPSASSWRWIADLVPCEGAE